MIRFILEIVKFDLIRRHLEDLFLGVNVFQIFFQMPIKNKIYNNFNIIPDTKYIVLTRDRGSISCLGEPTGQDRISADAERDVGVVSACAGGIRGRHDIGHWPCCC